jgi:hypothetical protein
MLSVRDENSRCLLMKADTLTDHTCGRDYAHRLHPHIIISQEPPQGRGAFLNGLRTEGARVAVFLVAGIRLVGIVEAFEGQ